MDWINSLLTDTQFADNMSMFWHILGATFLGLLVGFERSYRGRAAGMRTYGFVCMSSCALMASMNHHDLWYDGTSVGGVDPTRAMQGIVSGIGFLGAGVIMRDGLNISGLTTAASIWATSIIGILFGIGFHQAAIAITVLTAAMMMWGGKLEGMLPSRHGVSVTLHSKSDSTLNEQVLEELFTRLGYDLAMGSFSVSRRNGRDEWRFVVVAFGRTHSASLTEVGNLLSSQPGIEDYQIAHARN